MLVTGCNGQVGMELQRSLAGLGQIVAVDRTRCDLSSPDSIRACVLAERPDVIVNAGAWTAVDKAESERDAAFVINAEAPRVLAELATDIGAVFVHYSTDYVFDGRGEHFWRETDAVAPLNVYGAGKLASEEAIQEVMARRGLRAWVMRTTWVYASHGSNFLKTMLRLAGTRDSLSVVNDQFGAPTGAALIADVTARLLERLAVGQAPAPGLYHLAAAGVTNWQAYAQHVIARAAAQGLPLRIAAEAVQGIPASAYPTPAARPANSRLDCTKLQQALGITLPDWREGVDAVVDALVAGERAASAT